MNLAWFARPVKKLKGIGPVETLALSTKKLGVASAIVSAFLVGINGRLTSIGEGGLDLRMNSLGDEGWGAIIAAVCGSTVSKISSIDASTNGIGPAGTKVIADALRTSVNDGLTGVWMPRHKLSPWSILCLCTDTDAWSAAHS